MTFLAGFVVATLRASRALSTSPPYSLSNPPKMDFMSFIGDVRLVRLVGLLTLPNSPRVHRPVVIYLPLDLYFIGQPISRRIIWHHNILNLCFIYGDHRYEFISEIESKLRYLDPEYLICHFNPDALIYKRHCNVVYRLGEI